MAFDESIRWSGRRLTFGDLAEIVSRASTKGANLDSTVYVDVIKEDFDPRGNNSHLIEITVDIDE